MTFFLIVCLSEISSKVKSPFSSTLIKCFWYLKKCFLETLLRGDSLKKASKKKHNSIKSTLNRNIPKHLAISIIIKFSSIL